MDFVIPDNIQQSLQRIPTPWGTLVGLKSDRITQTILADGQYEWAETAIVGQLLRAGAVTLDVGANIGYYTALFHLLAGSRGQVHSFEANPFTAALLRRSKAENGWNNVRINNVAVGAAPSTIRVRAMDLEGAAADTNLNLGGWMVREAEAGEWTIDLTSLDRYVADNKLDKLHFLKVDVEGFELKVMEGGDSVIRKFRPYIIMEMRAEDDTDEQRCVQLLEFLRGRDFACCRIMKRPFPHFRPVHDSEVVGRYHFNMLAMPAARYREYEDSAGLRGEPAVTKPLPLRVSVDGPPAAQA
ncbi:MAG: FkbM family methyltransferase [Devosia sp.]